MHRYSIIALLLCSQSVFAGVFLTEEEYMEMADVVVVAEVAEANCVSEEESQTVLTTHYTATLTVQTVEKGDISGDSLILESSTYERGDEMDCADPGSVHPVGELAKYHLIKQETEGIYRNIDGGSTFELTGSAPEAIPTCDVNPSDPTDESKSCTTAAPLATFGWFLPVAFFLVRSRRKTCVNSSS